jgi:hypothetical protein
LDSTLTRRFRTLKKEQDYRLSNAIEEWSSQDSVNTLPERFVRHPEVINAAQTACDLQFAEPNLSPIGADSW